MALLNGSGLKITKCYCLVYKMGVYCLRGESIVVMVSSPCPLKGGRGYCLFSLQ